MTCEILFEIEEDRRHAATHSRVDSIDCALVLVVPTPLERATQFERRHFGAGYAR
jgi:hypothetical protein